MTVQTALHLTNDGVSTAEMRQYMSKMTGQRQGILGIDDLEVTEKSGTPDMSVDVALGSCIINPTSALATRGAYFLNNTATVNLAIAAADATNARKDLIVAVIEDTDYAEATDAGTIEVVTGTPAGLPAEPTVPDNAIVLAMVDVAALASSIVDANITDRRISTSGQTQPSALGGVITCTSANRPTTNLSDGDLAFETDTERLILYNGSSWVDIANYSGYTNYSPTFAGTVGNGSLTGEYHRVGKMIHVQIAFTLGSTSAIPASNLCKFTLPVSRDTTIHSCIGSMVMYDSSANLWYTGSIYSTESTQTTRLAGGAASVDTNNPFTWGTNDQMHLTLNYLAAA